MGVGRGLVIALVFIMLFPIIPSSHSSEVTQSTPKWQVWPELVQEENTSHLIWIERDNTWNGPTDLKYSRSIDGENWSSPIRLNFVAGKVLSRYHQEHPTIAVSGDEVRVFWVSKNTSPYQIRSIYSSDAGLTWRVGDFTYDMNDDEHITDFLTAEFDSGGGLHLVWQDVQGLTVERPLRLVSSADGGLTWAAPVTIDPFNTGHVENPEDGYSCECCRHTIVPSSDGGIDIIYRHVDRYATNETWYSYAGFFHWNPTNPATSPTQVGEVWITESRICPETQPQLVATETGLAALWNSAGNMYVAFDDGSGFTAEILLGPGGSPSMDYAEGILQFSWHDSNNIVHAAILHRNGSIEEVFAGSGTSERFPSISEGMLAYQKYVAQNWEIQAVDLRDLFSPPSPPGENNNSGNETGNNTGNETGGGENQTEPPPLAYDHFCDDVGVNCIYVENNLFQPSDLTIEPGEQVVFVWMVDSENHNIAQVDDPYDDIWNGGIRSGDPVSGPYNWSIPATALLADATIHYVCEPHVPMMRGRIVVGDGKPFSTAVVGLPAPDFTLMDADGSVFTLSQHSGEVVVLDLMATWCPNCEQIAEETLIPMQNDIDSGALQGVTILSVGTDIGESNEMLGGMALAKGYDWAHAIDTDDGKIGEKYSSIVPTVVVIDADGTVTFFKTGYLTTEVLRDHVDSLVESAEPEPRVATDEGEGWLPGFTVISTLAMFVAAVLLYRQRGDSSIG